MEEYLFHQSFAKFGPEHLIWLIIAGILVFLMCSLYNKMKINAKKRTKRTLAFCGLASELYRAAGLLCQGKYGADTLPLHLCAIAVYLCVYHSVAGGKLLGQFLYWLCLPGAVLALLFPCWSAYGVLHYMTVTGFLCHICPVAYVLMLLRAGELEPRAESAGKCFLLLLGLAVPVQLFNLRFGTNYMFLAQAAPGTPMEWLAGSGKYGHLLCFPPMLALCWSLMYFPFCRTNKKAAD